MSLTNDLFPFNQLKEDDFQDIISQSNLNLDEHEANKLRNMIFNPFSTN